MEFYLSLEELLGRTANPVITIFFPVFLAATTSTGIMAAWTKPDGRGLDIGPGSGIYLPDPAEHCNLVHATDIAADFLASARELAYPQEYQS
jgi:hypothetical protein